MLTMDDFVKEDDPILRKVALEVPLPASDEDKRILASLMEYVQKAKCLILLPYTG